MPIVQQGSLNTNAIVVADIYVQVVPPQNRVINGTPTNVAGVVGSASWGPLNRPGTCSGYPDFVRSFGPMVARKHDAGTMLVTASLQGANDFRVVRVSDGTDTEATATLGGADIMARYTGTLGNKVQVALSAGSRAATVRAVVGVPGLIPEVFDNLPATADFWAAFAAAVTLGSGVARGASQYVTAEVASTGAATAPVLGTTVTLSGGTDGADGVTGFELVGEVSARTGMYALQGSGVSLIALADSDDSTHWTEQSAFGLAEGVYMIVTGPAGDTSSAAIARKRSAGIDNYSVKVLHGDWLYMSDQVNKSIRLVSPQGFALGRLANLSPEQSSLNKQLFGIVGSQRGGIPGATQALSYSAAEIQELSQAGIDIITNPIPRGPVWGARIGHNSSTDTDVQGDNYTRMTNYISRTLAAAMGLFIGEPITEDLLVRIRATLLQFFENMMGQKQLGRYNGVLPYSVDCDASNNPESRVSLGYVQADVQVRYLSINERFLVNLEGGQTVVVRRVSSERVA